VLFISFVNNVVGVFCAVGFLCYNGVNLQDMNIRTNR
jgi:hypothetical protein